MFKRLFDKRDGLLNFSDYKKKSYKIVYFVMVFVLLMGVFITLFPLVWLFFTSLKEANEIMVTANNYTFFPKSFNLGKYIDVFKKTSIGKYFFNSIIVVIGASISAVIFNGLLAYGVSILKPKGSKVIFYIILMGMLIPPTTAMVPLFVNIDSIYKFIRETLGFEVDYLYFLPLFLIAGANPFYFLLFKTYFDALPKDLFESAQIDGANKLQVFFRILVPISKPIIVVVIIFTMNASWSDFLLPYLLFNNPSAAEFRTVMVQVYTINANLAQYNLGYDDLLSLLLFTMLPPVILFIICQKQITSNVATAGIK